MRIKEARVFINSLTKQIEEYDDEVSYLQQELNDALKRNNQLEKAIFELLGVK